jgi:hypothetical protein
MLVHVAVIALLMAEPFWETKTPRDWSEDELQRMFMDSPWAVAPEGRPPMQAYLATAAPMREAEAERARRRGILQNTALQEEYAAFLGENQGKVIVLAVRLLVPSDLADAAESKRMEEESALKAGRKRLKLTGHFPPTPSDPWLRLVFPRPSGALDKSLVFELYVPGVPNPYRTVELPIKPMMYKGRLEL